MAGGGRALQPGSRGAPGLHCKALGVCHGCCWLAGFFWGPLRWAGSFEYSVKVQIWAGNAGFQAIVLCQG